MNDESETGQRFRRTTGGWWSRSLPPGYHERATELALAHGILVAHPDDPTRIGVTSLGFCALTYMIIYAGGRSALLVCSPGLSKIRAHPDVTEELRRDAKRYRAAVLRGREMPEAYERAASARMRLACVVDDRAQPTVAGWSLVVGTLMSLGGIDVQALPADLFRGFSPVADVDPALIAIMAADNQSLH